MRNMSNGEIPGNVKVYLTVFRTWQMLEEPLKTRLVEAAKQCLLEEGPDRKVWSELDVKHYHTFALASCQALYLVLQKEPDFLATLPKEAWERLVSAILTSGLLLPDGPGDESNSAAHRRFVAAAHRYAPAELVTGIIRLLDREQLGCTSTYWNLLGNVEEAWNPALADALLEKASEHRLAPECSGSLLSILLAHRVEEAKVQAESLLALPLPTDERERQRKLAAALALVRFAGDSGWSAVLPAIESDLDFGTQLIASVAYRSDWDAQQLSEEQLADLYLWTAQQDPPAQPPIHQSDLIARVTANVASWKEKLLQQLKERGTIEACRALERIVSQSVELDRARMQWILLEAQTLARRRTWLPYSPANLLE